MRWSYSVQQMLTGTAVGTVGEFLSPPRAVVQYAYSDYTEICVTGIFCHVNMRQAVSLQAEKELTKETCEHTSHKQPEQWDAWLVLRLQNDADLVQSKTYIS